MSELIMHAIFSFIVRGECQGPEFYRTELAKPDTRISEYLVIKQGSEACIIPTVHEFPHTQATALALIVQSARSGAIESAPIDYGDGELFVYVDID